MRGFARGSKFFFLKLIFEKINDFCRKEKSDIWKNFAYVNPKVIKGSQKKIQPNRSSRLASYG